MVVESRRRLLGRYFTEQKFFQIPLEPRHLVAGKHQGQCHPLLKTMGQYESHISDTSSSDTGLIKKRTLQSKPAVSTWYLPDLVVYPDALNALEVRPIRVDERPRWRTLMSHYHYLSFQNTVGESLCYVATINGHWVALLAWASAALKSRHRENWVGWTEEVKKRRLHFIANNVRFLIHPGIRYKNLASKVLGYNLKRLSHDWEAHYKHPILLVETFVDESRYHGTCYRAAGWIPLGKTQGFGKNRGGYFAHGSIKTVFVRGLYPDVVQWLSAPFPPAISSQGTQSLNINHLQIEGHGGLLEILSTVVDPRKQRGRRHSIVTITAMAVCAYLSGASTVRGIVQWTSALSNDAIIRLGGRRFILPSEPTFRRTLNQLDQSALNQLHTWLGQQTGVPRNSLAQFKNILGIGGT